MKYLLPSLLLYGVSLSPLAARAEEPPPAPRAVGMILSPAQALVWDEERGEYTIRRVGDELGGGRIVGLEADRVVIARDGGRAVIELQAPPARKQAARRTRRMPELVVTAPAASDVAAARAVAEAQAAVDRVAAAQPPVAAAADAPIARPAPARPRAAAIAPPAVREGDEEDDGVDAAVEGALAAAAPPAAPRPMRVLSEPESRIVALHNNSAPAAQQPTAQQTVAQSPAAQQTIVQQPTAPQTVVQAPSAQAPVAQQPVAQTQGEDSYAAQAPGAQVPSENSYVAQAPAAAAPRENFQPAAPRENSFAPPVAATPRENFPAAAPRENPYAPPRGNVWAGQPARENYAAPASPDPTTFAAPAPAPPGYNGPTAMVIPRADLDRELSDFGAVSREIALAAGPRGGFRLTALQPGCFFERIGLRPGDVVMRVDGRPINALEDASRAYAWLRVTDHFTVDVWRAGRPVTLRYIIAPGA